MEAGGGQKTVEKPQEEKAVSAAPAEGTGFSRDRFFAAAFILAVPAAVIAAVLFLKPPSGAGLPGGEKRDSSQTLSMSAGISALAAPDQRDRLEFVGEDAPLTPLVPFRSITAPEDADEPAVLEKWKNGRNKAVSREWSFEGSAIEELCWFDEEGNSVGCGILKDGERWEGVFAQWGVPAGKFFREATILREIVCYKNGLKDGLARSYRYDGKPLLETFFSEGKQVRKRVFRQQDNQVVDLGSMRLDGLPESRRSRNTADK